MPSLSFQPAPPISAGPGLQSPDIRQIKQGGGMFAGGGAGGFDWKTALAAALAGFTARSNPGPQQALFGALAQKRQQALEEQQYQQRHQQELQDQMSLYDYKAAHAGPDDFTQRVQALEALKPGLGMQYAQTYAKNGGGLGLVTNPVTGEQYAQRPASPPAEAVARLKANPAEAAQFDEIFGPGTSAGILGGPTQPASGGFPGQ